MCHNAALREAKFHKLGSRAVGLAFLRAVDAAEADTFSMMAVQDFEGVAVEDGNDGAGEIVCMSRQAERELNNARTVDQPEERLNPGGLSGKNNL